MGKIIDFKKYKKDNQIEYIKKSSSVHTSKNNETFCIRDIKCFEKIIENDCKNFLKREYKTIETKIDMMSRYNKFVSELTPKKKLNVSFYIRRVCNLKFIKIIIHNDEYSIMRHSICIENDKTILSQDINFMDIAMNKFSHTYNAGYDEIEYLVFNLIGRHMEYEEFNVFLIEGQKVFHNNDKINTPIDVFHNKRMITLDLPYTIKSVKLKTSEEIVEKIYNHFVSIMLI